MDSPEEHVRYIRILLLGALGVGLMWAIVSFSFVAYLSERSPATALRIRQDPSALLNLAAQQLSSAHASAPKVASPTGAVPRASEGQGDLPPSRLSILAEQALRFLGQDPGAANSQAPADGLSPGTRKAIRSQLRAALARDPLRAPGLRMLGQIEDDRQSDERVASLMRASIALSTRETIAVYWLMRKAFESQDYQSAVAYADIILRTRYGEVAGLAYPILVRVADTEAGRPIVIRALAANPPWRDTFFKSLPRYISSARAPLEIFLALRNTRAPPQMSDINGYISVLLQNKLYDIAYYAWLQFLPSEQLANLGAPFNGDFEIAPSGQPFDWLIRSGAGVTAEVVPDPEHARRNRVLSIQFSQGRVEFPGISQVLLLPVGTYQFSAKYKASLIGPRGLVWKIVCAHDENIALGSSPMILGDKRSWEELKFTFRTPDTGCPAQVLRLFLDARSASEQLVSGWSLHDEVRIERKVD